MNLDRDILEVKAQDAQRNKKRKLIMTTVVVLILIGVLAGWRLSRSSTVARSPDQTARILEEIASGDNSENYEVEDLTDQFGSDTTTAVQTIRGDRVSAQVYSYSDGKEAKNNFDYYFETLSLSASSDDKKTEKNDLLILEGKDDYIVLAMNGSQVIYAQGRIGEKDEVDTIVRELGVRY